jgi:outer membrane receptor protein involved in Fe transport
LRGGLVYDDANRSKDALSPLARVQWDASSGQQYYLEYSEATQLPTYTATKSNPNAGLFRGNPNLGRETSRNLEFGTSARLAGWKLDAAFFYRWDDSLADWTYLEPPSGNNTSNPARSANAVVIGTFGFETVAVHRTKNYDLVLGYTYLHKTADYPFVAIDASFYALNFPIHRFTAALTWRLGAGWEIRSDNEYRVQEKNVLRRIGGNNAVISTLGLHYLPPSMKGWEFSVMADNLWDSDFQELPAVPAAPRQLSASVSLRW